MPSRSRSCTAATADDSDTGPPMADDGIAHQSPRWTGPPLGQPDGLAAAVDSGAALVGAAPVVGASVVAGASDVVVPPVAAARVDDAPVVGSAAPLPADRVPVAVVVAPDGSAPLVGV